MVSEEEGFIGLSFAPGIGPMRAKALLKEYGSAGAAYLAKDSILKHILGLKIYDNFIKFRKSFNPDRQIEKLKQQQIFFLTQADKKYPKNLLQIPDPPIVLYAKGNIELLNRPQIAVIGTRQPTAYGISSTQQLVAGLIKQGYIITSGLALGIDTVAHKVVLKSKKPTIAVLGCGVDICYPRSHQAIYNEIIKAGVVVSETAPGADITRAGIITRNRIVSGLSKAIIVIEGARKSGTMITARFALEQGKDVYAVPGPITSDLSDGPNYLISIGATPVTSAQNIIETLL
ncbi:DNA-protecting protein DprA [Candidatus Roizmanbacteria bacterium CG22_combo_CG10-13_8_21_14_all_38_20]|uniref:DNA-protecting protein DprA n=1 Tax=Candidatus Roizmanbacteria bacterium CG22_combo_CG10-13_8_21_14_all_38_20 TaxID=1974862 RepID=A0A2H0BV59_9BACT|nr:DNA-protecting protein DprA [Candidatus Microgenomates bacterium]PIP61429.1 MAG: DNA-protecting protein DprA [Candidatus Roizmanbacteria bacterium CG22_combo_CG10-13_8_21_14_all_38_20]PJC32345.1 MAG: DNA-protecting protein DprA [Candidatus Roizmanbacteria bacterium CG_4_9_14_0_2_um_filter_38_17]